MSEQEFKEKLIKAIAKLETKVDFLLTLNDDVKKIPALEDRVKINRYLIVTVIVPILFLLVKELA